MIGSNDFVRDRTRASAQQLARVQNATENQPFDVGYDRLYLAAVLVLRRFAAFHHSVWRTDIVSISRWEAVDSLRRKVEYSTLHLDNCCLVTASQCVLHESCPAPLTDFAVRLDYLVRQLLALCLEPTVEVPQVIGTEVDV